MKKPETRKFLLLFWENATNPDLSSDELERGRLRLARLDQKLERPKSVRRRQPAQKAWQCVERPEPGDVHRPGIRELERSCDRLYRNCRCRPSALTQTEGTGRRAV